MIRWKIFRKDWHLRGKRPQIGLWRKISNLYKMSSDFNVCLFFTKQVQFNSEKLCTFVITEQSDWGRKISLAIARQITRHKFFIITHKNNCCQIFSRGSNNRALFVNEYKFKVGWQSSSLKNRFSGFRRAKHKHLFSKSKPYFTTSYEHVSILTLGGL